MLLVSLHPFLAQNGTINPHLSLKELLNSQVGLISLRTPWRVMRLFIGPAKRTNWEVVPQLGYAIKEDMVIGLGIGYGASASETENAMDFEGNTFIIAP